MYLPSGKMILPNFWLVTPILEPPMSTTRWNNMSSRGSLMVCRTVFFEKKLWIQHSKWLWSNLNVLYSKLFSVNWISFHTGVYILNLRKTWEKLLLAARAIAAIENPADVCVISARPYGQRAVLKFASATGATPIAGRFTPGTFTNQIQVYFT